VLREFGNMSSATLMFVLASMLEDGAAGDGMAMASDAFFPFPDSAELATAAGVTVIIEPGGSIRDQLVTEAEGVADLSRRRQQGHDPHGSQIT